MKRMLIFPLLLGLLALTGCSSDRTHASEESFFAMDTVMQFTVYGDDALLKDAQDVIADIESKASVTNPDSELYAINRDGSGVLTGRAAELMEAMELWTYPFIPSSAPGDSPPEIIRYRRNPRLRICYPM